MEYMFNLLGVNQEVDDKPGANPLDVRGAELEFDAVDFGYNDDRQILHKLSFKVAAGKTTAIVGPSGSGKARSGACCSAFTMSGVGPSKSMAWIFAM